MLRNTTLKDVLAGQDTLTQLSILTAADRIIPDGGRYCGRVLMPSEIQRLLPGKNIYTLLVNR